MQEKPKKICWLNFYFDNITEKNRFTYGFSQNIIADFFLIIRLVILTKNYQQVNGILPGTYPKFTSDVTSQMCSRTGFIV